MVKLVKFVVNLRFFQMLSWQFFRCVWSSEGSLKVLIIQMVIKNMGMGKIMRETIKSKMRKGTNLKP